MLSPLSAQSRNLITISASVVTCHNAMGPHCHTGNERPMKAVSSVHYSKEEEEHHVPSLWNL